MEPRDIYPQELETIPILESCAPIGTPDVLLVEASPPPQHLTGNSIDQVLILVAENAQLSSQLATVNWRYQAVTERVDALTAENARLRSQLAIARHLLLQNGIDPDEG